MRGYENSTTWRYGALHLACVPQRFPEDAVELVVLRHGLADDPPDLGQFPVRDYEVDALGEGHQVVEGAELVADQPHAHVSPQRHRQRLDGLEHQIALRRSPVTDRKSTRLNSSH